MDPVEFKDRVLSICFTSSQLAIAVTGHQQRVLANELSALLDHMPECRLEGADKIDEAYKSIREAKSLLERKQSEFKRADAAWQQMAFGSEWR